MKKSQVTIFVIIGMIIIISFVVISYVSNLRNDISHVQTSSFDTEKIEDFLEGCTENAVMRANVKYGINQENKHEYETFVSNETKECMQDFYEIMRARGFSVNEIGSVKASLDINPENLILNVNYPLEVKKGNEVYTYDGYDKVIELKNTIHKDNLVIRSVDKRAIVFLSENTKISDINDDDIESVGVKIADENFNELDLDIIIGNVVYQLQPLSSLTSKDFNIEIKFSDIELSDEVTKEDLRLAYWDVFSDKWKEILTEIKGDYLTASFNYFTYIGIIEKLPPPVEPPENSEIPLPTEPKCGDNICNENEDCNNCQIDCGVCSAVPVCGDNLCNGGENCNTCNSDCGTCPPPLPPPYQGSFQTIFEKIKKDMGGTYNLRTDPACTGDILLWCWVHNTCGEYAIWCKRDVLERLSQDQLNKLFKHELTHNIQHINGRCGSWAQSEWGADYIGGSTYYKFKIATGKTLYAYQLAERMLAKGCTETELRDAALCKPGAYEKLKAKNCLLGNGDVALPP